MALLRNNTSECYERLPSYIRVQHSKRARRLALRLDPKDRVVNLVIPPFCSMAKAMAFVADHQDWIETQIANLPQAIPFTHGQDIPLFGQTRTMRIHFDAAHKRTDITIHDDAILIATNKQDPSARLIRFLKKEASQHLETLSHQKAALIQKNRQKRYRA